MRGLFARSFVLIMIIIALASLILRIAIDKIMQVSIAQNESVAQSNLKLISTALENYAKVNHGVFSPNLATLINTTPPFLDKDYIAQPVIKGYNYSCPVLDASTYSCVAAPGKCRITGRKIYTVTTGGSLSYEDCSTKE